MVEVCLMMIMDGFLFLLLVFYPSSEFRVLLRFVVFIAVMSTLLSFVSAVPSLSHTCYACTLMLMFATEYHTTHAFRDLGAIPGPP